MAVKNIIQAITAVTFDSSGITGTYQVIATLPKACFFIRIINDSTKGISISYDGTEDNDYIISETTTVLPAFFNSQPNTLSAAFAQGTQIWAKGTAGTGNIIVTGYYQPQT